MYTINDTAQVKMKMLTSPQASISGEIENTTLNDSSSEVIFKSFYNLHFFLFPKIKSLLAPLLPIHLPPFRVSSASKNGSKSLIFRLNQS